MSEFKTVQIRPMVGAFDTLSSADEVGFGNWRLVKNATTRSTRNRRRAGGFERLFADAVPYNNQDLHDQLTDRLFYYDLYSAHTMGGGGVVGFSYTYFAPASTVPLYSIFPPAQGPFCPVYVGDHPDGFYNGCPIFYPSVGIPYVYAPGFVSETNLTSHWKFDTFAAQFADSKGSLGLTNFIDGITTGLMGSAANFVAASDDFLESTDTGLQTGDITFGFTGRLNPYSSVGADEHVLGRWYTAGNRSYRLIITGGKLRWDVSNDGTATVSVTHPHVLVDNTWIFFAVWHDSVANTINIKVNNETTQSVAHTTGVLTAGLANFYIGLDQFTSASTLDARVDSLSFWKNGFPTESELASLFNSGLGFDYPFDHRAICNSGFPNYYLYSAVYTSCPYVYGGNVLPGYPYGPGTALYDAMFSYDYSYCGNLRHALPGCREAVTMLQQIVTASGRKLIAATMSRVYELNQSAGSWRILADGLGNSGYTVNQCTCNGVRGVSATCLLYTS